MGLFQTNKPKSAGKIMLPSGKDLNHQVLETLSHISKMVGATLGPGGKQVLIERPEMNMKPIMTKDGVTVIKHLGYHDATRQLILEAARDAAIRTASEAGDGTTTATILSSSIANSTADAVRDNPKISPQKIVREMQALVPYMISKINEYKIDINNDNYSDILLKVATLSANGDKELAQSVIEAFDTVGEEGNMTIVEVSGPSGYKVERIDGYTIEIGYEESNKNFATGFINDKTGTMVIANNPVFLLFDGTVTDISQIIEPIEKLSNYFAQSHRHDKTVILVAHGYSDSILGDLHLNWTSAQSSIKVYPLLTPQMAILNWRTAFLYDLQAYTGCPVFNPIDRPMADLNPEELCKRNRVKFFECGRFRSSVMVDEDPLAIEVRVEELKKQKEHPESEYELRDLEVRIGKLTSGIARLNICGPSQGETREKRDRAEDAWMAIRGATKHGAVPGGGYTLVRISSDLYAIAYKLKTETQRIAANILGDALIEPVRVLYANYGYNESEIDKQLVELLNRNSETFDISEQSWVTKETMLDSVPAVAEAVRNSISIASLLGTVGGLIAFKRDDESDKDEEKFARKFERTIGER